MVNQSSGPKKRSSFVRSTCHLTNIKNPKRVSERLKLSFQRVEANLCLAKSARTVDTNLVLLDISPAGVGVFTNKNLSIGSVVMLTVTHPQEIVLRGIVSWCTPLPTHMDSSKLRHNFRAGVRFAFESEQDAQKLEEFIQLLHSLRNSQLNSPITPGAAPQEAAPAEAGATQVKVAEVSTVDQKADAVLGAIQSSAEKSAAEAPAAETPAAEAPADEKKAA